MSLLHTFSAVNIFHDTGPAFRQGTLFTGISVPGGFTHGIKEGRRLPTFFPLLFWNLDFSDRIKEIGSNNITLLVMRFPIENIIFLYYKECLFR